MQHHEYVPSTKRDSCWRCGQPRAAATHVPRDANEELADHPLARLAFSVIVGGQATSPEQIANDITSRAIELGLL